MGEDMPGRKKGKKKSAKKAGVSKARPKASKKKPIEQYEHKGKTRKNNPPVGLVTPQTEKEEGKKKYEYDPHLAPTLVWAGKAERTSFEVPTVSLHVHERIDPKSIIHAVRKRNGSGSGGQLGLFERQEENLPIRDAIDFYKHDKNWSNRLIAGDSLLVMNSLLEKEGMAGQVQMVYIDPPYGIKYGSNFQPFVNKRDVKDGKDEDLNQEPEMIKAFRDTWELGIHSYLTYLRDRLLLAKELLNESGSIFMQISDENLHLVRNLMDEVFNVKNACKIIPFQKTSGQESKILATTLDYLVWYAKDKDKIKYNQLYKFRELGEKSLDRYDQVMLQDGTTRRMRAEELKTGIVPEGSKRYQLSALYSEGQTSSNQKFEFDGITYQPRTGTHWKTTIGGLDNLRSKGRIEKMGSVIRYRRFADDFPVIPITDRWDSVQLGTEKKYVVQTSELVIQRCMLMCSDPGDVVFDPTCGSGTTAYVAEQWGRRWITCDTSRVATALAKQRLMASTYDYYELARPDEGVGSGFNYKTVPHITLKSIANNEPPAQETLYDQTTADNKKARVTGPFTVEAVPAPAVKPLSEIKPEDMEADESVSRSGESLRQDEWRSELLKTGVRSKGGQFIKFSRVESLSGTRWLHADAETKEAKPQRTVISFGPEHAPLEQRQVELAWEESRTLVPKPTMIIFASFHFDPEAAKDIDELTFEKTGMRFLKAQMNTDLLTDDLKKKRSSNQSFWLIGQPDIDVKEIKKGDDKGKYQVEVKGFDYYNPKNGSIDSGDTTKIAIWMLDTDYDGRSLYPQQVFFPMAGEKEGWAKLAKNLKAEIDLELIEAYRGAISLPFEAGENKRIAVKIVDDRGIESLRIVDLER